MKINTKLFIYLTLIIFCFSCNCEKSQIWPTEIIEFNKKELSVLINTQYFVEKIENKRNKENIDFLIGKNIFFKKNGDLVDDNQAVLGKWLVDRKIFIEGSEKTYLLNFVSRAKLKLSYDYFCECKPDSIFQESIHLKGIVTQSDNSEEINDLDF